MDKWRNFTAKSFEWSRLEALYKYEPLSIHTRTESCLTFAAVLPHAQVNLRDVVAAAIAVGQLRHPEDVTLDASDVVAIVTHHPCQRGLFQLGQLGRSEHAWVFVPESEGDRGKGSDWDEIWDQIPSHLSLLFWHDGETLSKVT